MAHGAPDEPVGKVEEKRPKAPVGSRRIFPPQFKLQVLDSYRQDSDCQGNQRATARKYGIHRRQIQKWLQTENSLRLAVQQASGAPKPSKIAATSAAVTAVAVAAAVVDTTSGSDSDVNVEDLSDTEDSALDLSTTTCLDLTKRKREEEDLDPCKRRSLAPVTSNERPLYVSPIRYPYVDYPLFYCWPPCCYRPPCYVERPVPQRLTCSLDLKVCTYEQKEPSLLDISYPQHWNKQDYRFPSSV
ncbi:PREDICTED: uncharacterized protein LOC107167782 [Diuraphis noxia]|uniref:uncharacterized protein LOC107167782 n=1 Tax=Diuraphis noxia TaxID=143948 RepID=UPI0007636182|nr:PREDICTED: uncharacterized protein LOC107167782 [Diuraphis noxia]